MAELKLPLREEFLIHAEDYTIEAGARAARKVARMERKPTALLGMNDMVSVGLLQGLHAAEINVPGEISVLGFDDTFVTDITTPRLSSVGYDYRSYGAMLVETAVGEEQDWPANRQIPIFITERDSCARI